MSEINIENTEVVTQQVQETQKINIALAQSQFLVGDITANIQHIRTLAINAKEQGADIIVFPELSLLGYSSEELLKKPNLSKRVKNALNLLNDIQDIVMIIGYPHVDHHGTFNSAAIIYNGHQKGFYHKQHLPNSGIFDERRYFDNGRNQVLFDYKGISIGLLISEDLWQVKPIKVLKEKGVDLVISLNSSAFEIDKQNTRKALLKKRAIDNSVPIIYVNAVGGQDELVFDGGSMAVQDTGEVAFEALRFLKQTLITSFDISTKSFDNQDKPTIELTPEAEMYQALVIGLRDYVKHSNFSNVLINLSGDIDSALTLCIAVDALGADNVYSVMMPYKHTSETSLKNAEMQSNELGVSYTVCPIFDAVNGMKHTLSPIFDDTIDNTKKNHIKESVEIRARGMVLMTLSQNFGHLVIGSSNKSDMAIGLNTLYGDMAGGFSVLKDVYKTQVYALANYRNRIEDANSAVIPEAVINRKPTTELRANQADESSITDYDTLDKILSLYVEQGKCCAEIVKQGFDAELVQKIIQSVDNNEYKRRQSAIGTKVSQKAFGCDRRYPVVNHWSIED